MSFSEWPAQINLNIFFHSIAHFFATNFPNTFSFSLFHVLFSFLMFIYYQFFAGCLFVYISVVFLYLCFSTCSSRNNVFQSIFELCHFTTSSFYYLLLFLLLFCIRTQWTRCGPIVFGFWRYSYTVCCSKSLILLVLQLLCYYSFTDCI